MRYITLYILTIIACVFSVAAYAQQKDTFYLHIQVNDKQTKEPLEFALVYLAKDKLHRDAICDGSGAAIMDKLPNGKYKIIVSLLGYKKWEDDIIIDSANRTLDILLQSNSNELNEIIVTASESKGITSSSIIDQKAMQHLQPSSFTDLLELIPGGKAKDPKFSSINTIRIREVGMLDSSTDYNISSLGVSFVLDGAPISTDANMQRLSFRYETDVNRNSINKGVDMRSISTDQIESVEVVRGIPSVQYGDLTSGLVRIERKKGATPWTARLKVDGFSKLFAANKGLYFKEKNLTLNFGVDFLDSKNNPTNSYEGYQRLTYSIRLGKTWNKESFGINWQSNFDHGHTFDDLKVDPNIYDNVEDGGDLESLKKNRYKSKYDRLSFANNFVFDFKNIPFLKSIELNTSVAYELDKIEYTRFVQQNTSALTIPAADEGIAYGIFLPSKYLTYENVDGKPLNIFLKAKANIQFSTAKINHKITVGGEYTFDKNYGKGPIVDKLRPTSNSVIRARKFSDVPEKQNLNFFIEDELSMPIGSNVFKLNAGLRGMSMIAMDSQYKMNGKLYIDPRLNAEWSFPGIDINDKELNISLAGGIGWHSKFPTLNQIYPDYAYGDYLRLNYYDVDNPEHRWVNYETTKTKTVNYDLEPARNRKWEVRLNMQYDNNNFSVTYFQEKMSNGFRPQVMGFQSFSYKEYLGDVDYLVIDPETNLPDFDKSVYNVITGLEQKSATGNGTRINKEGIEYTFSTKRFETLKTRLTINGAWFRTKYLNNTPMYTSYNRTLRPSETVKIYQEAWGIFDSSGGDSREQFNTYVMFDTYIPQLGFEFSTSVQCTWYEMKQRQSETRYPDFYMDALGNVKPYTDVEKEDAFYGKLSRESNPSLYRKIRTPFGMDINLKASKKMKDIMRISLFVNKLLDYYPDYDVNGATIKRTQTPYFGMELNITL